MKRSKTLEFDSIHLQQIFSPAHEDKQPSRGAALLLRHHRVSVYVLRGVRGVHAPRRGTLHSHVHRSQYTLALSLKETREQ